MQCTPNREWQIKAPWGYLSLSSWGNSLSPPVFLLHGRQDSSATFQPLLQLMDEEEFHFVALDMPGSGNSDPFPNGVMVTRFHFVAAIDAAIEHLRWDKFIFIGHSLGAEVGLFYNSVSPGKMTKMILLDPEPTLRRLQVRDLQQYQAKFYNNYYDNYLKQNYDFKTYTIEEAKQALVRARNLSEDKASIIVSKSLKHIKDDKYRFTWDRRLKFPAPQNYPNTYYFALFSNIPPTIIISASDSLAQNSQCGSLELLNMLFTLKDCCHIIVEGSHDVHLTHPEKVAPHVKDFLRKNTVIHSKL